MGEDLSIHLLSGLGEELIGLFDPILLPPLLKPQLFLLPISLAKKALL